MKRILFVDDELDVLSGLRTMLHRRRHEWDMHFASSGAVALNEIEKQPFDLICSDMRMPEMDGAQLLREVAERWPHMVRIVLSGFGELGQTIKLVPVAHQYLSKPCEGLRIEATLDRCLNVQDMLKRTELRALVGRVKKLPAQPKIYQKLCAAMLRRDVNGSDVAKIIASDAAIAARILQVANSAFFRLSRQIAKIEQAVSYLGFTSIRNLALSAEVLSATKDLKTIPGLSLDAIRVEAVKTAAVMREFTKDTPFADDAFIVGLLHNVGLLVLVEACPDKLELAVRDAQNSSAKLIEAEQKHIGTTHMEVGAYLLAIWGLPYFIVDAVANQNRPERPTTSEFDLWAALTIALQLLSDAKQLSHSTALGVDESFLARVAAPFKWDDAQQAVRNVLAAGDTL